MANDISRAPTPAKRGTGKPPPKPKKKTSMQIDSGAGSNGIHDEESDEDELEDDGNGVGRKGGKKLVWDKTLTWALITHINENAHIKRGLYPPSGQNLSTASGGGKPKSDFHSELAEALFDGHDTYGDEFAQAKAIPAKLAKWAGKIKNRVNTLEKKTRQYFAMMCETGQGITREDEIDMSADNALVNKWRSIKAIFPYYFEMLELIGQRPNIIHAGVGNSLTVVDVNAIMGHSTEAELLTVEDIPDSPPTSTRQSLPLSGTPPSFPSPSPHLPCNSDDLASQQSRKRSASVLSMASDMDDKEAELLAASIKAQTAPVDTKDALATPKAVAMSKSSKTGKSSGGSAKKTSAQPATSTPTPKGKGKGSGKKLKFGDQFSDIAAAEEQTHQKELDVRLSHTELEKLKLQGKIETKREKMHLKAEMQRLAMVQEHKERMARLEQRVGGRQGPNTRAIDPAASNTAAGPSFLQPATPSNFWTGGSNEDYWSIPPPSLGDPLADPLAAVGDIGFREDTDGDVERGWTG